MALWMLAAFLAFFVKGLCGFADALIFTTMMSFQAQTVNITPVALLLACPANAIQAWKGRAHVRWRLCLGLTALLLLGCVPGAFFLKNADSTWVKLFFGLVVVALSVQMLLRELSQQKKADSKWFLAAMSLLAGVVSGLYGIGALMSACVGRIARTTEEFKGTLGVVFFAENVFRVALYTAWGIITAETLRRSLLLIPVVLAGLLLGMLSGRLLNEKAVRKLVVLTLFFSGLALVVTNGLALL